jgi:hypothetical protein
MIRSNFRLPFRFFRDSSRVRLGAAGYPLLPALRSLEAAASPAQRPPERFSNHKQLFFAIECKKTESLFACRSITSCVNKLKINTKVFPKNTFSVN